MPQISIIVPVYNVEPYIHRCVDSILAQTFIDYELILVDDGSQDNCGAICDEYAAKDSRIYVIHKKNGGLSSARNAGIELALANNNSEWITFIDSDDWISNDYLMLLYSLLINNNADISACDILRVYSEKEPIEDAQDDFIIDSSPESIWVDKFGCSGYVVAKLFPISYFNHIRFPEGCIYEDVAIIHLLLFQAERMVFSSAKGYYYYYNNSSITNTEWNPKHFDILYARKKQLRFLKKHKLKKAYDEVLKQYIERLGSTLKVLIDKKIFVFKRQKLRFKLLFYYVFKREYIKKSKHNSHYYVDLIKPRHSPMKIFKGTPHNTR